MNNKNEVTMEQANLAGLAEERARQQRQKRARQLELAAKIDELRRAPRYGDYSRLAQELGVSRWTIRRDIDELRQQSGLTAVQLS